MTITKITLNQIRALYFHQMPMDFPAEEIKPLAMIEQSFALGQYHGYICRQGDKTLAYALFVGMGKHALFDYYAVRQDLRGQGLGSAFIQALIDGPLQSKDVVLLEVEDPDCATTPQDKNKRERRLYFYLRNRLSDTGVRSIVNHVPYRVLSLPMEHPMAKADIRRIYAELYKTTLPDRPFQPILP